MVLAWAQARTLVAVTDHDVAVDADRDPAGVLTRTDGGYWRSGRGVSRRSTSTAGDGAGRRAPGRAAAGPAPGQLDALGRAGPGDHVHQSSDGGTFTLATAGRGGSETGIPDVDAVLRRYDCGPCKWRPTRPRRPRSKPRWSTEARRRCPACRSPAAFRPPRPNANG